MMQAQLLAAFLIISPTCTGRLKAFGDMNTCYILDGVLILYGVVLTVLYCRLRMNQTNKRPAKQYEKQPAEGGIYAGLTNPSGDTYETIRMDKKPPIV